MWEAFDRIVILLAITSPLVGIVVMLFAHARGVEKNFIRESAMTSTLIAVLLLGYVIVTYRPAESDNPLDEAYRNYRPTQMSGSLSWIGDRSQRASRDDGPGQTQDPTSPSIPRNSRRTQTKRQLELPIVSMAWGVDGIRLGFLLIVAIIFPLMTMVMTASTSTDAKRSSLDDVLHAGGMLALLSLLVAILTAQDAVWMLVILSGLVVVAISLSGKSGGAEKRQLWLGTTARWTFGTLCVGLAVMGMVYALSWMRVWSGEMTSPIAHLFQPLHAESASRRYFDAVAEHLWSQMSPLIGTLLFMAGCAWLPIIPVHRHWIFFWNRLPIEGRLFWMTIGGPLGFFGLIAILLPLFSPLSDLMIQICGTIGMAGFLIASCIMSRQRTRLDALSYGIVAQQGLCLAAVTCGERTALWGGIMQILSVSLSSGLILWNASNSNSSIPTTVDDQDDRYRHDRRSPLYLTLATLSLSGIPGTLGFISRLLIVWGLLQSPVNGELLILTIIGLVFGAEFWQRLGSLPLSDSTYGNTAPIENADQSFLERGMLAGALACSMLALVIAGVCPSLYLDRLRSTTVQIRLADAERHTTPHDIETVSIDTEEDRNANAGSKDLPYNVDSNSSPTGNQLSEGTDRR